MKCSWQMAPVHVTDPDMWSIPHIKKICAGCEACDPASLWRPGPVHLMQRRIAQASLNGHCRLTVPIICWALRRDKRCVSLQLQSGAMVQLGGCGAKLIDWPRTRAALMACTANVVGHIVAAILPSRDPLPNRVLSELLLALF